MNKALWLQKSHLFRTDEFVCSKCAASFPKPYAVCPSCYAEMEKTKYAPSWVDEAEGLSAILDDDW